MSDLIHLAARLRVDTQPVDGWIIATCPLLHVVTQGDSVAQALERIREEIQELIAFASERGVLRELIQHRLSLSSGKQPDSHILAQQAEPHWVDLDLPVEAIRELSNAA